MLEKHKPCLRIISSCIIVKADENAQLISVTEKAASNWNNDECFGRDSSLLREGCGSKRPFLSSKYNAVKAILKKTAYTFNGSGQASPASIRHYFATPRVIREIGKGKVLAVGYNPDQQIECCGRAVCWLKVIIARKIKWQTAMAYCKNCQWLNVQYTPLRYQPDLKFGHIQCNGRNCLHLFRLCRNSTQSTIWCRVSRTNG